MASVRGAGVAWGRTWGVRRFWLTLTVAVAAAAGLPSSGASQEVADLTPGDTLYEFRLVDGSVLIARVTEVDGDRLVLTTSGGARLEVERDQIREVNTATGELVDGEYRGEDPNQTRLFFLDTGRALRQGQAYLGTYFIIFPFVAVGVTDRVSLAAGAPILIGELEPVYFAPKVQLLRTESAAVSVGVLGLAYDGDTFGIAFGTGTFGSPDRAIHLGIGFGFSGDEFANEPVGMIGAETRISPSAKLITENYFLPGETSAALTAGVRFIGDRVAADLGVGGFVGDDNGCCLPLINISYAFGRR